VDYDSNVCYGYDYYRLVSASDIGEDPDLTSIPWTTFFTATLPGGLLENCVLAPVTSVEDLNEIAAAAGLEEFTFVGIRKPANDVVGKAASDVGWKNLDDTDVPDTGNQIWENSQPNNDNGQGAEIYAVFRSVKGKLAVGKLYDVPNYTPPSKDFVLNKAVMKCCAKGYIPKTFCSAA